jgi:hypothetical protein
VYSRERLLQILVAGEIGAGEIGARELAGNVSAGDQVIHVFQELFHAGIKFIQISDHRNLGGTRPGRGLGRCGCVVAIQMKSAGVDDPIALEFFGTQSQAAVAPPKNGAFARSINKNERLLAGATGRGDEMRLDAEAGEFRAMEAGSAIFADLADVARAESPLLARYDRRSDLATGQN